MSRSRIHALAAVVVVALGAAGCVTADDVADADVETTSDELTRATKAAQLLYLGGATPAACAAGTDDARVRCLLRTRYASDAVARDVALDLFTRTGGIAGLLPPQQYDGGYRGMLTLVPELPVSGYRQHLVWTRDAMKEIDAFFVKLDGLAPAPIAYRYKNIDFRYFRSVGRTTPSAFTQGLSTVSYNVSGTLVSSPTAVRETIFHEIFHENDFAKNLWSNSLIPTVSSIIARCGTNTTCLAPYTPTDMRVRGGTYYAFQPGNDTIAIEYAAELATRFYEEQSARMRGEVRPGRPFKCGPPENAYTWRLIRDAFFGGGDYVPPCQ